MASIKPNSWRRFAGWGVAIGALLALTSASAQDVLRDPGWKRAPLVLTSDDEQLLDEIQHGAFLYLWREVGSPAGLVRDRTSTNISSIAAVGFQLSALPIGVERGWVTRDEAEARALSILTSLTSRTDNQRFGVYQHFLDQHTAGHRSDAPEVLAGTIDHALLQAGAIPAAIYFGGEVRRLVDQVIERANWRAFVLPDGFVSMGWKPHDRDNIQGEGELVPWKWHFASAEEQLVCFLAVASPTPDHALEPAAYYRLKRTTDRHAELEPYVVSWNGSMFTYFFQHCWLDMARYQADDPQRFGIAAPRVDWYENTRRAFATHRQRCLEASPTLPTLAEHRWGLGPCMGLNPQGRNGYLVPGTLPNLSGEDKWHRGTVAPYVAASALPFLPAESLAALREMRNLRGPDGQLVAWRSPEEGGYGLADSFLLDPLHVPDDHIGIDVGPLLLAIENARTGLVWRLFHQHPSVRAGVERLGWEERSKDEG